jgi:hypothetical protein
MSNTVWDAGSGWHDGQEVDVQLDSGGRITTAPRVKFVDESGAEVTIPCQWMALCDHDAVTVQPHPILGDVPICDRCKKRYDALA